MEEEDDHPKYTDSETPHFFRIILHETLENRKLAFPKSFVRDHGRGLCMNKVSLKVPSGDVWEVELHREGGDLWLRNGWQEFVEFYRIKFGHFLVFHYQGNSEFHVLVFNRSTSEIKYPLKSTSSSNRENADANPCLLSIKHEVEKFHDEMLVDRNVSQMNASNCTFADIHANNSDCLGKGSGGGDYDNGELRTFKSFNSNEFGETADATIRAKAFNSRNPSFQITMLRTFVKHYVLALPGEFVENHIGPKDCYMEFYVPCGRFWRVKCRFRRRTKRPIAQVQMGWKEFVKDNNLVAGDVCVFELVDSVKVRFQVTISKAAKESSFSTGPGESTNNILI